MVIALILMALFSTIMAACIVSHFLTKKKAIDKLLRVGWLISSFGLIFSSLLFLFSPGNSPWWVALERTMVFLAVAIVCAILLTWFSAWLDHKLIQHECSLLARKYPLFKRALERSEEQEERKKEGEK